MPLQVIGAGFGRTGTMSLKNALEELGFGPCYHMIELTNHPEKANEWLKAAAGKPTDWDFIFDGYHSITDFPGCLFYKELMARYPEARVILTVRDAESWYQSARRTIFRSYPTWRQTGFIFSRYFFSKRVRQLMQVGWLIRKTIFRQTFKGKQFRPEYGKAVFRKHNEEVINTVPSEKLLVYDVKDGWEPLCHFLGVPVPNVPFPRSNSGNHFHNMKAITLREAVSDEMKRG